MTAPLSLDLHLRRRIARAVEDGTSARQAAAHFDVSPLAAIKLMPQVRQTGSPAPGQMSGQCRPISRRLALSICRCRQQASTPTTVQERTVLTAVPRRL